MKILNKKILVLFLSCCFVTTNAQAVVKLDFFEPVADFAQKVQKQKNKIEEKYTATLQKLNEKVRKAFGAEGAALFDMVTSHGKYIIKQAVTGQLSMNDLNLSHLVDAVKSELGNYKLDVETLINLRADYIAALKSARQAKEFDMQKELVELQARRAALNEALGNSAGPAQLKRLEELQKEESFARISLAEGKEKLKTYEAQIQKAQKENAKMQGYIDTIKKTLGDNITESEQADIRRYEQAMEMNNQTVQAILAVVSEYKDQSDRLKEIQAARASLNETLKDAATKDLIEELDKTDQAIAMLQEQIVKNSAQGFKEDMHEEKIIELGEKINSIAAQISADALIANLDSQVDELFGSLFTKKEEVVNAYSDKIKKLFLGRNEVTNPRTVARIVRERKNEYYWAYKNMLEKVVESYKVTAEASEKSEGCLDASTQQADGLFGAMSMRVCNDIQSAKAAIQYTQMMLAQLRLDATEDLQGWSDAYAMVSYDHDIVGLNLDSYVMGNMKMNGLLKQAQSQAADALNSAASGAKNILW